MTGCESNKYVSVKGLASFCGTYCPVLTTGSSPLCFVLVNLVALFLSVSPVIATIVSVALCFQSSACCEC